MAPHIRIARPASDLVLTEAMYCRGLGLQRIGHFEDHDGFDGVILGDPAGRYHFEFTRYRHNPVSPSPSPEDLIVFYVPKDDEWEARCAAMIEARFRRVAAFNPYWDRHGRTFEDLDGYRVVIQNAEWR